MVENCDRGQHFQARGPNLSRQIIFFSCSNGFAADYKWVCLRIFVTESGGAPSTNDW